MLSNLLEQTPLLCRGHRTPAASWKQKTPWMVPHFRMARVGHFADALRLRVRAGGLQPAARYSI